MEQKYSKNNCSFLFGINLVNLLTTGYGVACGWTNPTLPLLMSDDSPLPTGKIVMEEASWIAGTIALGGLVGNLFFGYITNLFGRKIPLLFIAAPTIVCFDVLFSSFCILQ